MTNKFVTLQELVASVGALGIQLTPDQRCAMVDRAAEDILRHYGVEPRRGADILQ